MNAIDNDDHGAKSLGQLTAQPQSAGVACDLSAIPAEQRTAHAALARQLFLDHPTREVDDGVEVTLPAERLEDAGSFIRNERLCCRHLAFSIHVPARGSSIIVRVTGPGARDELGALVHATPDSPTK
jgi:hypothetical protein